MNTGLEASPDDIDALKAALVAARAEVAIVRAQQSDDQALIAHLKLQIEKLNRDRYGPRSERTARLLDQLELTLEDLETAATEDELAAEMAAAKTKNTTTTVASFTRKRPSRKPFPDHLPRERDECDKPVFKSSLIPQAECYAISLAQAPVASSLSLHPSTEGRLLNPPHHEQE